MLIAWLVVLTIWLWLLTAKLCRRKRRFRVVIVGCWRIAGMDYLLLSNVAVLRANGAVTPLASSEFTLVVSGPGVDVPVPEWAPEGTQAAVQISGEEGTIYTEVTSALFPDVEPLVHAFAIENPAVTIVGNWTRVTAP